MSSTHPAVETSVRVPMDPRIRRRRAEVQRAAGRRRLRILAAAVATVGAALAAYGTTRSPLLDVDTVAVQGADHTSSEQVLRAAGMDRRTQMTDLDIDRTVARLEALPWVRTAAVRRDWPGTVEIAVVEREARAVVVAPSGEHFAFVDGDGRILGHAPAARGQLPLLVGVAEVPAPGRRLEGGGPALAVLEALGGQPPVAEVHVRDEIVDVVLASGTIVQFGRDTELGEKVVALRTLARRVDLSRVAAADLRVPTAPALTPR